MIDRGHHRGVLILPARGADARRFARGTVPALGRNQQGAVKDLPAGKRQADAIGIAIDMDGAVRLETRQIFRLLRRLGQSDTQVAIGEHDPHDAVVGVGREVEGAGFKPVADPDAVNGATLPLQQFSHTDRGQHGVAGRGDGRDPSVEPCCAGYHRVGGIDDGAAHPMAGKRDAQG